MGKKGHQNRRPGSLISHNGHLVNEAQALITRLDQVQPFALTMPMVRAANIPEDAQLGINKLLVEGTADLRRKINAFIKRMKQDKYTPADKAQRIFALLKLKFNALLDQLDIFADVLTQRGEHDIGIWLAGLDTVAKDALSIVRKEVSMPPLITYLDRGHGAAIRRARTRLPGGKKNPVAVIRVPRERMVSSGIASSLVHEVGHQGAALLGILPTLKTALRKEAEKYPEEKQAWMLYERWISEIISDCWSVGIVGIGATTGLMGVVSLPSYFVFRMNLDDPHPFPWIRVKISSAFGAALYPDPQWSRISQLWSQLYPTDKLPEKQLKIINQLEATIPAFVRLVLRHRTPTLKGKSFGAVFPKQKRQPVRLRQLYNRWKTKPDLSKKYRPSLAFAVLGQARADNKISARTEARLLTDLLRKWAVKRNV
ncbi:MAG: hypothetical protein MI974_00935 [Chitinophagales bacterium]|nr:hypothetical protein [Chitinophagales bacterium]